MKRYIPLILLFIAIGLTAVGCSSSRYDRRYPGYGYPGYSSYDLETLADDLEDATSRVEDAAKDFDRDGYDGDEYAIDRLEDLDDEAEDFRSEVDDERDLRKTGDDYQELARAYHEARNSIRYLRGSQYVYREFERVSQLMSRLNSIYGSRYRDPYGYYPGPR